MADDEHKEPLALELEHRELYLAKIPASLGAAWKKVTESDLVLGQITLGETDKTGRTKGSLVVNTSSLDEEIPTEYRVEFTDTALKLKVFSQDGSGRMAVEGKIKESCSVMPQRNLQYSKLCKKRLLKSMIKDRYVKPLEDLPKSKRNKPNFTIDAPIIENEERERIIDRNDKKVKIGKDELKNLVFHRFEEREFWPLKELNFHCRQPESYLKEILREICVYHRKGPNKSCYELKPQYKHEIKNST